MLDATMRTRWSGLSAFLRELLRLVYKANLRKCSWRVVMHTAIIIIVSTVSHSVAADLEDRLCVLVCMLMEALCSESVGLTSQRGDMQPTIPRQEWLYLRLLHYQHWCKHLVIRCCHLHGVLAGPCFSSKYNTEDSTSLPQYIQIREADRFEEFPPRLVFVPPYFVPSTLGPATENSMVSAKLFQRAFAVLHSWWNPIFTSRFVKKELKCNSSAVSENLMRTLTNIPY